MDLNKLYNMDCRAGLRQMIEDKQQVDCVISSLPYWSLRDYGIEPTEWDGDPNHWHEWQYSNREVEGYENKAGFWQNENVSRETTPDTWKTLTIEDGFCECGAWLGSLGLEPTFDLFIKHLCDIYDQIKRVLKKSGTCWVNLGDTYASTSVKSNWDTFAKYRTDGGAGKRDIGNIEKKRSMGGIPQKCLLMIPQRFAIEMINRGWILRNVIIWHKPNCMPSSARDRFTVDFEYVYFFTKSKKYYFEQLKEPIAQTKVNLSRRKHKPGRVDSGKYSKKEDDKAKPLAFNEYWSLDKNKRTVWSINTKANKEFHFATFPPKLVEPMIKAGSPRYVCSVCGEPAKREYEEKKELEPERKTLGLGPKTIQGGDGLHHHTYRKFIGYSKCSCGTEPKNGVVLDPFAGTGTTLLEAWKLGRDYIGFEISSEYCEMAEKLLEKTRYKRLSDF